MNAYEHSVFPALGIWGRVNKEVNKGINEGGLSSNLPTDLLNQNRGPGSTKPRISENFDFSLICNFTVRVSVCLPFSFEFE